jgi:hypothetical protein
MWAAGAIAVEARDHGLQEPRSVVVVVVAEIRDEIAPCIGDQAVSLLTDAESWCTMFIAETSIGMIGKQAARIRTVVEDQPFDMWVSLLLDAAQGLVGAEGRDVNLSL